MKKDEEKESVTSSTFYNLWLELALDVLYWAKHTQENLQHHHNLQNHVSYWSFQW